MKTKKHKSILNIGVTITYKMAVIAIGLLLPKMFITNYGSEINGLQASVKQLFMYIALLEAGVGASTLQMLYKPVSKEDYQVANSYLSAASYYYNKIGIVYFIVLAIMGGVYSLFIPINGLDRYYIFIYILISGTLIGINFFYIAKLKLVINAEGDVYLISGITMVTYIVSSIVKITLISRNVDIVIIEALYLFINLCATACYFLIAQKKYPWISFKEKPDYTCTEQRGSVLIHKITSVVFQNIDVLLLTIFCSLKIVSIYTMYKMIVNMVTSVIGAMSDSVHFIFGQKYNTENDEKKHQYRKIIDTYNVWFSAIAMGLYTVVYLMILPFLNIYTEGMDVNYIYEKIPLFYIVIEYLIVGREAMMRTIDVAGHFRKTQWRAVIESIINVLASVMCVNVFMNRYGEIGGLYGVLCGTIVALLYRTLDINFYASKYILKRKAIKPIKIMITNLIIFLITINIFDKITININSYKQFILNGCWITIAILGIYCGLQVVLYPEETRYIIKYINNRLN